jgi:hypothetical protein
MCEQDKGYHVGRFGHQRDADWGEGFEDVGDTGISAW